MVSSLSLLLPFLLLNPSPGAAISLNDFQKITGFSASCTLAYSQQIPNCGTSDFQNGNACSSICISSLQVLTGVINTACGGEKATDNTLIGKIFVGQGVTTLCPNAASQGGGQASVGTSQSQTQATSTILQTSIGISTSSTSSTSSITTSSSTSTSASVSTTSSTSSTSVSSSSSSTDSTTSSSSFDTSSTASPSTTSSSAATSTTSATSSSSASANQNSNSKSTKSFTTTAFNNGQATTITSQAQRTGSSNPDAFGGGGSPFEVGDNGTSGAGRTTAAVTWSLVAVVASIACWMQI